MSFQYPADPKDGDIVVRGDLQAYYDAGTNTWQVSQLPSAPGIPGPPGPPGPPGEGVSVSGSAPTPIDLPDPATQENKFWMVLSDAHLYFSDGAAWNDLGSPVTVN